MLFVVAEEEEEEEVEVEVDVSTVGIGGRGLSDNEDVDEDDEEGAWIRGGRGGLLVWPILSCGATITPDTTPAAPSPTPWTGVALDDVSWSTRRMTGGWGRGWLLFSLILGGAPVNEALDDLLGAGPVAFTEDIMVAPVVGGG